jgi:hypothetical protein
MPINANTHREGHHAPRTTRPPNLPFSPGTNSAESPCSVAAFAVNSEPHTAARPSVFGTVFGTVFGKVFGTVFGPCVVRCLNGVLRGSYGFRTVFYGALRCRTATCGVVRSPVRVVYGARTESSCTRRTVRPPRVLGSGLLYSTAFPQVPWGWAG